MTVSKCKTIQKMQVKFSQKVKKYSEGLTKPVAKAVKDITKGIISSRSVIVRQIAQSLHENPSLDKVSERLYRNLKNAKLENIVSENLLKNNCSKATQDTYFLVDGSDIIKPESNKLEGLDRIRDGSTGNCEKGFHLLNITSLTSKGRYYSILPICSHLYSNKIDIDTSSNILEDKLVDITIHSNNKGTYVFDRGYDDKKLLKLLSDNDNNYILRCKSNRNLVVDNKERKLVDVARDIKRKYEYIMPNGKRLMCGIKKVRIITSPHKLKNPETIETYLVVARYGKKGGLFYFYCDFNDDNLTDYQIIIKALKGYGYRWKIEEYHRHVKQEFNWEKVQLMSYAGLKNINSLLMIAVDIIYSSIKYIDELLHLFPEFGEIKKKDLKFIYYRLGRVINHIFNNTKLNKLIPHKGEYHDKLQLRINFS